MDNKIYNIDKTNFINIVKNSYTFNEIYKKCGYKNRGNLEQLKKRINEIKFRHFTFQNKTLVCYL